MNALLTIHDDAAYPVDGRELHCCWALRRDTRTGSRACASTNLRSTRISRDCCRFFPSATAPFASIRTRVEQG